MSHNFLDCLKQWSTNLPDKTAWTFLNDSGVPNDSISYQVRSISLKY